MEKYFIKVCLFFGVLLFSCSISFHSEAQNKIISTHISKGRICINEPFLVNSKIYAATDSFQKQKFPGFVILKGPTYSISSLKKDRKIKNAEINEYTIDTSHTSSLKYLLIPDSSGKLFIRGAVFFIKNKEVRTSDTSIIVSDNVIGSSDSIKIIDELWPESNIDKLIKEKVDSNKIDVSKLVLTSDFNEMKVKLSKSFTITYKLNYLLFNKIYIDSTDFDIVKPPQINIISNEVQAQKYDENYHSLEIFINWKCVIKPKKKGKYIIKPAVIYVKGQPIRSNEIKIIVK